MNERTDVKAIDLNDAQNVPLTTVYIGLATTAAMQEIKEGSKPEDVSKFQHDCKNFLTEVFN